MLKNQNVPSKEQYKYLLNSIRRGKILKRDIHELFMYAVPLFNYA